VLLIPIKRKNRISSCTLCNYVSIFYLPLFSPTAPNSWMQKERNGRGLLRSVTLVAGLHFVDVALCWVAFITAYNGGPNP
jgi:hypothetical protein